MHPAIAWAPSMDRNELERIALVLVDEIHGLEDELDVASLAVTHDEGDHSRQIAMLIANISERLGALRERLDAARGV